MPFVMKMDDFQFKGQPVISGISGHILSCAYAHMPRISVVQTSYCVVCHEELQSWEGSCFACCGVKVCKGACVDGLRKNQAPGSSRLLIDNCPQCRVSTACSDEENFSRIQVRVERSGDAEAQRCLAFFYYEGKGVQRDVKQAVHFFQLAADQGEAMAQRTLGVMMRHRQGGLTNDDTKVERLLWQAAKQGYPVRQCHLGCCYSGEGRSLKQRLTRDLVDQGIEYVEYVIGFFY